MESAGKVKMCAARAAGARIILASGAVIEAYSMCLNVGAPFGLLPPSPIFLALVHVAERAGARTTRISA